MSRNALSHTADTGLEATAPTFPDLVEELAMGMFELMADADCSEPPRTVETTVEAESREDLIVDVLSELLYLSETEDTHFCRFEVSITDHRSMALRASGMPNGAVEVTGPPIKAVTYHQLEVTETDDGWYDRVYFDV